MLIIHINKVVWFSPSYGVNVQEGILDYSPKDIHEMLTIAYSHMQDNLLVDACCGGSGPFSDFQELSLQEYVDLKERFEKDIILKKATKKAKQENTQIRRKSFDQQRARLVLQMIDTGIPYVCVAESCEASKNLTIDHITPLSKGGSDKISNLQFMCRSHNSSKGDRTVT